jgi:enoyl-CoA hydratase/carnithine racemase
MQTKSHPTGHANLLCAVDAEGIARGVIDRPAKRNALSLAMWQALGATFDALSRESAIRCVILAGAGDHFSAGADISEFGEVRADAAAGLDYDRVCDEATIAIRDCRKPVIAAVSGFAVGGGLGIALACDFRVVARSARMGIPAGRLGLVYSILDCSLLVERIGATKAKRVLFTGSIFSFDDCVGLGLVDVDSGEDAMAAAAGLAGTIAGNAPLSLAGNKAIIGAVADGTASARRAELEGLIAQAFDSEDYREGQRAFAEKRPPAFRGA